MKIPWYIPEFDEADAEAVKQTVLGGYVNEGALNRTFEEELKTFFGVGYAVNVPNGTVALALSLMALGVGPGDTVLMPDLTFIGTAGAVRLTGAEPILTDVDPRDFNIDPDDAKKRCRPNTKAIVAVHLNGRAANLDALKCLGLPIVEDAAQALAVRHEDGYLGTGADLGAFSLAPTKLVSSGQGGFILTRSKDLHDRLRELKDHGRIDHASDEHKGTGFNFKFTDMQAALILSQWKKLSGRIEKAKAIDERYRSEVAGMNFPARPVGTHLMWPDFVSEQREHIIEQMADRGIGLRPFWPAIHTQPAYRTDGEFPGAEEACRTGCWLPCSPGITQTELDEIIKQLNDVSG